MVAFKARWGGLPSGTASCLLGMISRWSAADSGLDQTTWVIFCSISIDRKNSKILCSLNDPFYKLDFTDGFKYKVTWGRDSHSWYFRNSRFSNIFNRYHKTPKPKLLLTHFNVRKRYAPCSSFGRLCVCICVNTLYVNPHTSVWACMRAHARAHTHTKRSCWA